MVEPWHYLNLRKARIWFEQHLLPELLEARAIEQRHDQAYWKVIIRTNHVSVVDYKRQLAKIKQKWYTRPRFYDDRDRDPDKRY